MRASGSGASVLFGEAIALDVDDVVAAEQTLKRYGVAPIESPCELEKFNTRLLKITDPNGICIALRENII